MTPRSDIIGTKEAAAILGMERSVFTRRVNAPEPLLPVVHRGSGATGEKFFARTDVEALAASTALDPPTAPGHSTPQE